jgi:hypothetical protein
MAGLTPRPASRSVAALLLAAVLVWALSGCTPGTDDGAPPSAAAAGAPVGAAATSTRGAELRAALTYLLTERVHLVIEHARLLRATGPGGDDVAVLAARRAVEASTEATVEVLATSYSGAAARLDSALRGHDGALLAHTSALAAADDAAA